MGLGHLIGGFQSDPEAAGVDLAGARQIQRRAVIHGGANDRQAQRDVDGGAEAFVLSTGRPWSWYIASTASQCSRYLGVKSVSAGSGPYKSSPSLRRRARVGSMMSISSRPRWPLSPACGFRPHTRIRGRAMPNLLTRSACRMRVTRSSRSAVIASATSRRGR